MKQFYELNKNLFVINNLVYCTDDAAIKNESAKAGDYFISPNANPNSFSLRQILEVQEYNYKCDAGLFSIKGSMINGVVVFTNNPDLKTVPQLYIQGLIDPVQDHIVKLRDNALNSTREHWQGEVTACNAILSFYKLHKAISFMPPEITGIEIEFRTDTVISGGLRPVGEIGGKGLQYHNTLTPANIYDGRVVVKPIYK